MLDSETKRRIDTARDILVGKLPDPKSQVEQITIALIYKFMDDMDKESEELGGKARFFTGEYSKYSWSKIFDSRISGHEMFGLYSEAITRMSQNPNIPRLFRDIFKNAYLPYRDPETLKSFLKVINDFHYDHSEKLGDAFEYLLSVMSSQGEAGQFRTPRHIIDFIVKVIDPGKNETILDPACGTAGFLISAYKHILNKYKDKDGRIKLTPDERKRLVENFMGYDISPDMVRLSLVNLYLHGFQNPHIYEYDTLTSEERWNEVYDVVMANPPFMTPKGGIRPHKRFSIQANRSEVLFVDYIAEHLNPNGRAGIIVPEGIIFQSGTAYRALRKMLLEHSLYAVVSLPAGLFNPYSGVKTSILLMDKNLVKKSNKLLFVKIENDGFGLGAQRREVKGSDLPLALEIIQKFQNCIREGKECKLTELEKRHALIVEKKEINEDYNLSAERYRVGEVYSGKWDLVELGEVAIISSGNSAPQGEQYFKEGKFPFYRTSDVGSVHISTNLNSSNDSVNDLAIKEYKLQLFPKNTILFPKSGASTFLNHRVMISKKGYVSSHLATIIPKEGIIKPLFLFNMLCQIDAKDLTPDQAYPSLKLSDIEKIKIPLPPLEVQEQIVSELESYQNIIDGAKQVVESYKPSFKIEKEWELKKFEEVCTLEYGKGLPKENRAGGKYPVMGSNGRSGYHDEFLIKGPAIIVGRKGSAGEVVWEEENCFPIDTTYYVKLTNENKTDLKFVYYILKSLVLSSIKNGAGIPGLNRQDVYSKFKIPFPPIETQKQIVGQIEEEQKLVDSNKKLIELFEKKIKDKIAEVWGDENGS